MCAPLHQIHCSNKSTWKFQLLINPWSLSSPQINGKDFSEVSPFKKLHFTLFHQVQAYPFVMRCLGHFEVWEPNYKHHELSWLNTLPTTLFKSKATYISILDIDIHWHSFRPGLLNQSFSLLILRVSQLRLTSVHKTPHLARHTDNRWGFEINSLTFSDLFTSQLLDQLAKSGRLQVLLHVHGIFINMVLLNI